MCIEFGLPGGGLFRTLAETVGIILWADDLVEVALPEGSSRRNLETRGLAQDITHTGPASRGR